MELADLRESYTQGSLKRDSLKKDPVEQFSEWFEDCVKVNMLEPNAMVLATVGADGMPSQRTVLLKGLDAQGFTFYTNYTSRKGQELEAHPNVGLLFPWIELERQVIISGSVVRADGEEADEYFSSRPRISQLGAWASKQSEEVESREVLESRFTKYEKKFEGKDIPRPEFWGGYRVIPLSVEFWQGGNGRMHDRLRFERETQECEWVVKRYAP